MRVVLLTGLLVALSACRDDAPDPDLAFFQDAFDRIDEANQPTLPSEDPFRPGEVRWALRPIYEADASRNITPDLDDVKFNVFPVNFDTVIVDFSNDRVEGDDSMRWQAKGLGGFWGAGYFGEDADKIPVPFDLSGLNTMSIAFKSRDSSFSEIPIAMQSVSPDELVSEFSVLATAYGYENDGEWHQLYIPLSDFIDQGLDITRVNAFFSLSNDPSVSGDVLLIDNVYFDADTVEEIEADIASR